MAGGGEYRVRGSKRKERYKKNIIRKRKMMEEDGAFYNHMLQ